MTLVACNAGQGFVDATVIDSITPDARADADIDANVVDATPPADAAPVGPVQVTVYDPQTGAPVSGRAVAFLNTDDSVAMETVTDENGVATAAMASGGSVTVAAAAVFANDGPSTVVTWLGVNIGDELVDGVAAVASSLAVTLQVPALGAGTTYDLTVYCPGDVIFGSDTAAHHAFTLPANCTTADVYVEAYDVNSALLGGFVVSGQNFADGSTVQLAGPFKGLTNVSASIQNLPQEVSAASLSLSFDVDDNAVGAASQTRQAGRAHRRGFLGVGVAHRWNVEHQHHDARASSHIADTRLRFAPRTATFHVA